MSKAAELAKMGEVLTNSQIGGRRNIIINGAMQVAQRATSATGVGGSSAFHTLDRMNIASGTTAGRATMSQSTDTPNGFANSLKLDCTTADTSVAADESFIIEYKIEGQDVQQLKKGTSDAEKVTLSFYVKGNASATYTAELIDVDNTRYNSQEFSVTTSWTRVTLTYDGDTTGTLDNDNAHSLGILFWLHAGSTFTGGTHTDNSWHTTNNQRVGDNQTSFLDSTDREFFITGIQLEVGSTATPFEHRSFGEELALCKRYFQTLGYNYGDTIGDTDNYEGAISSPTLSGGSFQYFAGSQFPIEMRAAPTVTIYAIVSSNEVSGKVIDFSSGGDLGSTSVNRIKANGYGYLQSTTATEYGAVYRSVMDAEL